MQDLDLGPGVQAFTPQAAYLNGRQCTLTLSVNVTNQTPTVPVDTSLTEASTMVSLSGTDIIGVDGNVIQLRGINYFGFEQPVRCAALSCCGMLAGKTCLADQRSVQIGMLDGLYIGTDTLTGDYATVLYRIQLLGFNAIRIPFSFQASTVLALWATCNDRQQDSG